MGSAVGTGQGAGKAQLVRRSWEAGLQLQVIGCFVILQFLISILVHLGLMPS